MPPFSKPPQRISRRTALAVLVAIGLGAGAANVSKGSDLAVAISSRAARTYRRARLPDGTFRTETFAFGRGGLFGGAAGDSSIDKLDFMDLARTLAGPLASQGYRSSADPKATKLLIMVYWGATLPPSSGSTSSAMQQLDAAAAAMTVANIGANEVHFDFLSEGCAPPALSTQPGAGSPPVTTPEQAMADNALTGALSLEAAVNRSRDRIDARNAALLGYDSWWAETADLQGTPREFRRQDMLGELEESRYFVVLMAYDFQALWKHKQHELLWETRYSIRERGSDFKSAVAAMTGRAAAFFGRDSHGLLHQALPQGRVEIGPDRVLGYEKQ